MPNGNASILFRFLLELWQDKFLNNVSIEEVQFLTKAQEIKLYFIS